MYTEKLNFIQLARLAMFFFKRWRWLKKEKVLTRHSNVRQWWPCWSQRWIRRTWGCHRLHGSAWSVCRLSKLSKFYVACIMEHVACNMYHVPPTPRVSMICMQIVKIVKMWQLLCIHSCLLFLWSDIKNVAHILSPEIFAPKMLTLKLGLLNFGPYILAQKYWSH